MSRLRGNVPILVGDQFPGKGLRGPADYKGQLFLEQPSGNYYRSTAAGKDVEWERVFLGSAEELFTDPEFKIGLKDNALFVVDLPTEWTWDFGFKVLCDGKRYFTNYDVSDRRNRGGKTIYVNTVRGLDTNNGSELSPVLTLMKARTDAVDGDTIVIQNKGVVYRQSAFNTNKSINIVAQYPGETYIVCADNITWSASAGRTEVYESARTNVRAVVDIAANPEGLPYKRVADLATLELTRGSWYQASDGTGLVYVKPLVNGTPSSATTFALLNDAHFTFDTLGRTSDQRIYLEGLNILGGNSGVTANSSSAYMLRFTAKNCKFLHGGYGNVGAIVPASLKNGLNIVGNVESYCQGVTVAYSGLDGFNYHWDGTRKCKAVEINCVAHDNGTADYSVTANVTNIQNGSTSHDGCPVVRIGCKYWRAFGAIVADVHVGTMSLNFSCEAGLSTDPGGNNASFCAQQAGTTMWLYDCVAYGTTWNLYAVTGTTIYRDPLTEFSTTQGGGVITTFTP